MSFSEQIQLWGTIGTWLASLGTIAAVFSALWLARRTERVRLRVYVGLRHRIDGIGSQTEECLSAMVTNLGERPVYVVGWGWKIGKGTRKRHLEMSPPTLSSPDQFPRLIEHGGTARFMVSFAEHPDWINEFRQALDSVSDKRLRSLRAKIYTSVGHIELIAPEVSFLNRLKDKCVYSPSVPDSQHARRHQTGSPR